jgi:hypothetical protein
MRGPFESIFVGAGREVGSDKFWPNHPCRRSSSCWVGPNLDAVHRAIFLELTGSRGDEVPLKTLVILASFCQKKSPTITGC